MSSRHHEHALDIDYESTGLYTWFKDKHEEKEWYKKISDYLMLRYSPIIDRIKNSFRYVDFDPININTCSYEYASLLRDIGSVFSSVLDTLVKGENRDPKYASRHNILDYRDFLFESFPTFNDIVVELKVNFKEKYVLPFRGFRHDRVDSVWWDAYNAVKHSDIDCREFGCLSNVVYSMCALTFLYEQFYIPSHMIEMRNRAGGLIEWIWYYDLEAIKKMIFPLPSARVSNS